MANFSELNVLVTGASQGIGLAVARQLASKGAWVGMVARTEDRLMRAAADVGGEALPADVSDEASVERLYRTVFEVLGSAPHVVINSAGSFSISSFVDTSLEVFDQSFAANLRGPFLVTRAFLPAMLEREQGHILNIGSVAGRVAFPGNAAYSAAKYGLRGLHEVLVEELRGTGVRATLVEPAATDTPIWDPIDPDSRPGFPSRAEMLTPDDVARAILFALEQPANVEISHLAVQASA